MEGASLLPRSSALPQQGCLTNFVRALPGKFREAGQQVADPVCAQGGGRVREQEESARGVSTFGSLRQCILNGCRRWRGVRDEALSQLSGIDGCIFVHMSGFIGGEYEFAMRDQS